MSDKLRLLCDHECLQPAQICLRGRRSFRNIAPEKPVRIGVMNFITTASENDRYFREKYIPESAVNL